MILCKNQRYESDGRLCGPSVDREMTPGQAAVSLVRFELGYGGSITELQPHRVVIRTSIMGRYDITEFSGSEEEMLPLMKGVAAFLEARKGTKNKIIDNIVNSGINTPLMLNMVGSVMFSGLVDPALYCAADLTVEQATALHGLAQTRVEEAKERAKNQPYNPYASRPKMSDTIDPVIELVIDGSPFDECLQAA